MRSDLLPIRAFVAAAIGSAALTACEQPLDLAGSEGRASAGPVSESHLMDRSATLLLERVTRDGKRVTVDLVYRPTEVDEAPRTAEIWLQLSDALAFTSAVPGDALVAADKELVAQAREGGQVRLVIYSTSNVSRVAAGVLATLQLEMVGDGPATVDIRARLPGGAPAPAHPRVRLPDNTTVVGG